MMYNRSGGNRTSGRYSLTGKTRLIVGSNPAGDHLFIIKERENNVFIWLVYFQEIK